MVDGSQFHAWVQEKAIVDGLVQVYKPYGIPSTALVEMYKKITSKKVGHGGTLDPLAEGALLLGIGAGTKLLTKYLASEKRYRAEILIGASSFSGDLELPIELSPSQVNFPEGRVKEILIELSAGFTQELPAFNASKQNGKTAYSLIREGKTAEKRFVETKLLEWKLIQNKVLSASDLVELLSLKRKKLKDSFERFVEIGSDVNYRAQKYEFLLTKWEQSLLASTQVVAEAKCTFLLTEIEVLVPKGTYIRSLAQDIATRLGAKGLLIGLCRI